MSQPSQACAKYDDDRASGASDKFSCAQTQPDPAEELSIAQQRILSCNPRLVLAADANPWKVAVVDVSSVRNYLSTSTDIADTENALSYFSETGEGFADEQPENRRFFNLEDYGGPLRYKRDQSLVEGPLFTPGQMEDKWAIYVVANTIRMVRSWQREVSLVAYFVEEAEFTCVNRLEGSFYELPNEESPEMTIRMFDFILRLYALNENLPAPLPLGLGPRRVVTYCMSMYGNRMNWATWEPYKRTIPNRFLRTNSKLHIAVAKGQLAKVRTLLNVIPNDVRCPNGWTPLHWAADEADIEMMKLLIESGVPVDQRSEASETALVMLCDQLTRPLKTTLAAMEFLLKRGADPNVVSDGGWTCLHKAAEVGSVTAVILLLAHGAREMKNLDMTPWDLTQRSKAKATAVVLTMARLRVYFAALGCSAGELNALWHVGLELLPSLSKMAGANEDEEDEEEDREDEEEGEGEKGGAGSDNK